MCISVFDARTREGFLLLSFLSFSLAGDLLTCRQGAGAWRKVLSRFFVCSWSLLNHGEAQRKRLNLGNLNPIYERELTKLGVPGDNYGGVRLERQYYPCQVMNLVRLSDSNGNLRIPPPSTVESLLLQQQRFLHWDLYVQVYARGCV